MFNPIEDSSMVIREGDVVAARCHMENKGDQDVRIGLQTLENIL